MTKYTRVYSGSDGESHFEDVEVPVKELEAGRRGSAPMKADQVFFLERDSRGPWHIAPRRQFLIITEGELVVEIGNGEKRRFLPGDVLLAEDTTGRGHFSDGIGMKAIVVPLA
jgi:quercetin dioxygenase-like cupin family protein